MKCPKCDFCNPSDSKFCKECGTQLGPSEDISAPTETIEKPREELTTGSTFAGRYQIIEELGKGGMGKVYKALDTEIKEKVALKLIKPEIAADKRTIERFRNELKFARKISHRNVCRMYDLNKEEGSYYITMEYVSGEDLKSFIRRSRQLTIGTAIFIAKQVCEGLTEAHRWGVVHRDLKPQNIMIDKEGNARIMDFGIARSLRAKGITGSGVMIGTPEYMSPEQVEGKEADQRSDIYSLGVILYEMVTGRVPFEGDTPFSIGVKHKSEIPKAPKELNAQIPEDLNRVILRCLEKDKEKRYQSAGELRSELENIEKGIPTTEKVIPKRKPLTSREITVTFGVKRLFVPALIFLAIVITGLILWHFVLNKEVIIPPSEKRSIAVISFKNQTGNKVYDYLQDAIPNLLITSLEQSGYLHVITWERMHDLLKQMGKEDVEIIDRDLGFELCRLDGIDAIVLGSFIKAGEIFATDVKVLDVETKSSLKSASSKGKGEASILERQIDELSQEISRGIGIPERKISTSQVRIADVTTTSMEAYNYFLRGRADYEKWYFDEARKFLEKAVELDPTFAVAHLYLAWANGELGNTEARDKAYEKAKIYSEKATEKERLYIEAYYARRVEKDPEKRFRILKQIAEKYPDEKKVHYDLGFYYQRRNQQKAIEEYNKTLELDPDYGYVINQLAYLYIELGNFEKAIEYLKRYASVSPGDANPIDSLAELYYQMGNLDESIAKYKEALEIKPDFGADMKIAYIYALREDYAEALKWIDQYIARAPSAGIKAEGYIWKGFYYHFLGRLKQAFEELRNAEDLAESVRNQFRKATVDWTRGWISHERGEFELGQKNLKSALDLFMEYMPQYKSFFAAYYSFYLGLVDLKQGQINAARSRLSEINSFLPEMISVQRETMKFLYDLLSAEVLLAEGATEEAVAVFEKAVLPGIPSMHIDLMVPYNAPFPKDVIVRASLQKGDVEKAIAEYKRIITFDPNSKDRRLIHPKYYYRLAKLYEDKGWKEKAIEHYEKFLDLWKDADPGMPEVEDAKKRLAGLQIN